MGAQRVESVTFAVTDRTGQTIGTLTPPDPGAVTCTGSRRVLRGLDLNPADWEALDPYDSLIAPTYTIDGVSTQVGVYAPKSGTAVQRLGTQQPQGAATVEAGTMDLADQTVFLDVTLTEPVGLAVGQSPSPVIEAILEAYGFTTHDVTWLPATAVEPTVYDGTALDAIDSMCEASGAYPLYFTADGVPTVRMVPAPEDMTADHTYSTGDGLVQGRPEHPRDWFSPNRWEAQGGTDDSPQTGVYELPNGVPGWQGQRGFLIIDRFQARGVTDQSSLDAAARSAAVTAFREARGLSFDVLADPAYGSWDVIDVDQVRYLVESWTLPLTPGSLMGVNAGEVLVPS